MSSIKAVFLDIGGVLLTNGWDHALREKTAKKFQIDYAEMDSRHRLIFDTYETGKLSFDEYLAQTIFYKKRSFSPADVEEFICTEARPYSEMIEYVKKIKKQYQLKVGTLSNEGKELAVDRIRRFDLGSFIDFFIVSSFVHLRKPDVDIYHMAIDIMQVPPKQIVYIDDREMLVEVARKLGIQAIHHKGVESTRAIMDTLLD